MKRFRFLVVAAALGFALTSSAVRGQVTAAAASDAGVMELVGYGTANYRYLVLGTEPNQWFSPTFDDAAWSLAQSPLGTPNGCALSGQGWPLNTDVLVRQTLWVPDHAVGLKIGFAIDNDLVAVYWNGTPIFENYVHEGCPGQGVPIVPVPRELVVPGALNTLAVKARDRGGESYYDHSVFVALCGNGIISAGEQCDDGNTVDGDGCDSNCTLTACGNGILTASEHCDDENTVSGDGCSADCGIQQGWQCSGEPSRCVLAGDTTTTTTSTTATTNTTVEPICGNGLVERGEQCDDGGLDNGDGCSGKCVIEGNPPTARFTTSGVVGFVGLPLGFDAFYSTDPENALVSYDWDFGDGSPHGHAQAMSRVYANAGTYDVTLTVTDGEGLTDATGRQIQVLPADQIGLFNAYVNFTTSFDRSRGSADRLSLSARVNIGDAVVAPGDTVALEIAGQRFSAVLDQSLRATVAGVPSQKWQVGFGQRNLTFGEVEVRLKVKKADVGLGFNLLGALPGGDLAASVDVPVKLEIGSQSFLIAVPTDFRFTGSGMKARGDGASE